MKGIPGNSLISSTDPLGHLGSVEHTPRPQVPGRSVESTFDLQKLLRLWTAPPRGDQDAADAMRAVYADPVVINGISTTVADLVTRARSLVGALENVSREIIDVFQSGDKVAVAFRLHGAHTGPLATSAGVVAASGNDLTLRVIDILTLKDGLITEVVMVADELGALNAIGAVSLIPTRG